MSGVVQLLDEIAAVGRSPSGGYRRFAFTRQDADLGEWFAAHCTARGFEVGTDRCGNQWAWRGPAPGHGSGKAVVLGSHLDSVPDGGAYDGPLGIASAFAAIDLLDERGVTPARPIGLVRFLDEEGARFGLACSGSRLLTGSAAPQRVLALRDGEGISYAEAAAAAGIDPAQVGPDAELIAGIGVFVELHVEQGRALALPEVDAPVAVADRIRPHGRWQLTLNGRADHAGTTLLADRDDPMLTFARVVLAVRAAAERHGAFGTVGKVLAAPNAVNAIAERVSTWLDVRADTADQVRAVIEDVRGVLGDADELDSTSVTEAVVFDRGLAESLAGTVAEELGVAVPALPTGAGHDAGVLAEAGVPTAMLFVRNPTGASHTPREYAEPADCDIGVQALAAVLNRLAGSPA